MTKVKQTTNKPEVISRFDVFMKLYDLIEADEHIPSGLREYADYYGINITEIGNVIELLKEEGY